MSLIKRPLRKTKLRCVVTAELVFKPGILFEKDQVNLSGGAVSVFRDYDLGGRVDRFSLLSIICFPVQKNDHVCILFYCSAVPKV